MYCLQSGQKRPYEGLAGIWVVLTSLGAILYRKSCQKRGNGGADRPQHSMDKPVFCFTEYNQTFSPEKNVVFSFSHKWGDPVQCTLYSVNYPEYLMQNND